MSLPSGDPNELEGGKIKFHNCPMPKIPVSLKYARNRGSDWNQFGKAHCHMTDKSPVVQTLLGFFFLLLFFSGQQKKVRKPRQMKSNVKDS